MPQNKYFVGQVANLLSGSHLKTTEETDSNKPLADLFSVDCTVPKLKKSKKQHDGKKKIVDKQTGGEECLQTEKTNEGFCPPKGIVHESLLETASSSPPKSRKRKFDNDTESEDEDSRFMTKKKKKKHEQNPEVDRRTVFVGNVSVSVTKKDLKKIFSKHGKIENLRFRCPPTVDPKIPKKLVVINKEFHPNRHNMIAFVCFNEESAAKNALAENGHLLQGLHLRVDLASRSNEHDSFKSVFVGNLPFALEEEDLRSHFRRCGKIENVRIVRDSKTGIGKGFGYVQFKDPSTVTIALMLRSSEIGGREIRVKRCSNSGDSTKVAKKNPAKRRILEKQFKRKFQKADRKPMKVMKEKKKKRKSENTASNFKEKRKKNDMKPMKKTNGAASKHKHKHSTIKQKGKLFKPSTNK